MLSWLIVLCLLALALRRAVPPLAVTAAVADGTLCATAPADRAEGKARAKTRLGREKPICQDPDRRDRTEAVGCAGCDGWRGRMDRGGGAGFAGCAG